MDLTVPVSALPARELSAATGGECSATIGARVLVARARQLSRGILLNARLHGRQLRAQTALDADARGILDAALTKLALTARGHDRVMRVARTIADLEGAESIAAAHLAEALQFRGE
jgi:magnesium chelatase family protein